MHIKVEDLMAVYKWAYIATVHGKQEIELFSNTRGKFIYSLEYASGIKVDRHDKISTTMLRRAKEGMIWRASLAHTPKERNSVKAYLDRWFYMDAVFNGGMPVESLKAHAIQRMEKLGIKAHELDMCILQRRIQPLLRKGYTVESIKKQIRGVAA